MEYKCLFCSQMLEQSTTQASCLYCSTVEETEYTCPNNHYFCEECRLAGSYELLGRVVEGNGLTDPIRLANLVMTHYSFPAHGPEHHQLIAVVLLVCLKNAGHSHVTTLKIKRAMERLGTIPSRACGTYGNCGACVGAGVATSVLLRATHLSNTERSKALAVTGRCSVDLADQGGPRCCKASVYTSLGRFLQDVLSVPTPEIVCEFKGISECKMEDCLYYK